MTTPTPPRKTADRDNEDAMQPWECVEVHKRRRIVLTGGAGKTTLLELIRQYFVSTSEC